MMFKFSLTILTTWALWHAALTNTFAANVNLIASDILSGNQSSLDTSLANGNHWSNSAVPSAGNDYFTSNFVLRSPANGNSITFAGASLTVNNTNDSQNGGLWYKGTGTSGVITIDNLILNGGIITHQNGTGDLFRLEGNLHVAANSQIFARQGTINVGSTISGSATITNPGSNNASSVLKLLSPSNTFIGNIINNGRFELVDDGVMNFVIGASGINNSISGLGAITALNGDFLFNLSGAGSTIGNSWSIVTASAASYGSSFNVVGFTQINNVWRNGIYQFSETTGLLSVEPAAGDVNGDGNVDELDYAQILAHFRSQVSSRSEGDLNGDGVVNLQDFAEWRLARAEILAAATNIQVPEPVALNGWLLMTVLTAIACRHRNNKS